MKLGATWDVERNDRLYGVPPRGSSGRMWRADGGVWYYDIWAVDPSAAKSLGSI